MEADQERFHAKGVKIGLIRTLMPKITSQFQSVRVTTLKNVNVTCHSYAPPLA